MKRLMATLALGVVGVLGLTACGARADAALATPEQSALAALGFDQADLLAASDPTPSPGASNDGGTGPGNHPRLRKLRLAKIALHKNVLHAQATVQTKDGVVTLAVQRGVVTAINDKTMTVKSTDGFTMTWTFGDPIHVIEHRTTVQPSDIAVGTEVGVAGPTDGSTNTAKLVVVPTRK